MSIMKALGLVETSGLTAAIAAADAAVKSANVELLGYENTRGGGRITIKLLGDVGAVNAAVAAAKQVGGQIGTIVSTQVIARPHDEIVGLIGVIDRGRRQPEAAPTVASTPDVKVSEAPAPAKPKDKGGK